MTSDYINIERAEKNDLTLIADMINAGRREKAFNGEPDVTIEKLAEYFLMIESTGNYFLSLINF